MAVMSKPGKRQWEFKSKFRAGLYSWNGSAKATKNLRAAVSEICKGYKTDPLDAVEAAVCLMGRFWPAFQDIDSSSGALGGAVSDTIDKLLPLVVDAPADEPLRKKWTLRLFDAICNDGVEYLGRLTEQWGRICATDSLRDHWIEELLPFTEKALKSRRDDYYYFVGTSACLSCLLESGRYDELRQLLDFDDPPFWPYESYWAEALLRQDQIDDAIRHAQSLLPGDDEGNADGFHACSPDAFQIKRFCEYTLYDAGRRREAYEQYSLPAYPETTYLNHFRSLVRRYPEFEPGQILMDLIEKSGRPKQAWFSSARKCELYDLALECAESGPVNPSTLTTAARDTLPSHPDFAWRISLLAVKYLLVDYVDVSEHDVIMAVRHLIEGARSSGHPDQALVALREVLDLRKKAQKIPGIVKEELKRLGCPALR
jgi:hypothetical protein